MKIIIPNLKIICGIVLFCCIGISCEDFVDIAPPDSQLVSEIVFSKDETAIAAVKGMYHRLYDASFSSGSNLGSIAYMGALSADEIRLATSSTNLIQFEQNEIFPENSYSSYIWNSAYITIYNTNAILAGLASSNGLSEETQKQLEGHAKFIRAFTNFYLVNIYGDVPIITTTDYNANTLASRNTVEDVFTQIMLDLTDAYDLIDSEYEGPGRTMANKSVVAAMLARVYLYRGDWVNAEKMADEVIGQTGTYELLEDLNDVFLMHSRETIWSIEPVGLVNHTKEGNAFILTGNPGYFNPVVLTDTLVGDFEDGDKRYDNWIGIYEGNDTYYHAHKYKVKYSFNGTVTEHSTVIRLAEMYLIRAEARIQQNRVAEGIADLNVLRERARGDDPGDLPGLPTTLSKEDALLKVEQERRIELFTEWGHRWLDLKRTGRAEAVLSSKENVSWESTDVLYPIPDSERLKNPNLGQNDGY